MGSSRKKMRGLCTRPRAISSRRRMPPESVLVCASRHLVRSTASSTSAMFFSRCSARHAVELGVDRQVLFDGQILVAGQRLRNHADHAPHVVRILAHVVPGHDGLARGDRNQRGHHADERALARAVRPQQAEDLALGHAEVHVLHRFKVAVALDDVLHRDGRGARRLPLPLPAGLLLAAALTASPAWLWECRPRPSCRAQTSRRDWG